MKAQPLVLLVLILFFSACSNNCVEDLGVQSTKEVSLKPFDEIDVQGAIKLILIQDSSYRVEIRADSNLLEHIKADVSSGKLRLKMHKEYCGSDSVVVRVGIGELDKLTASGAVQVLSERNLTLNNLDISMSGSNKLWLDVNAGKLTTIADGTSEIHLAGQAGTHLLTTNGTSEIDAFNFVVGVYNLDIDGSGRAKINVLNELKVKTSGTSEVYYKGNPQKVDEEKSGAAKLEKVN